MLGVTEPGPGFEHADPGRGQKAHLRRQLPRLLASIVEILRELRVEKQDGFAGGHSILGSAKAENVDAGAPGHLGRAASKAGTSIGKAGAVHVKTETKFPADRRDGPQFVETIDLPSLGRLRDRHHPRLWKMDIASVGRNRADRIGR